MLFMRLQRLPAAPFQRAPASRLRQPLQREVSRGCVLLPQASILKPPHPIFSPLILCALFSSQCIISDSCDVIPNSHALLPKPHFSWQHARTQNEKNVQNRAKEAQLRKQLSAYEAELAQWQGVETKYAVGTGVSGGKRKKRGGEEEVEVALLQAEDEDDLDEALIAAHLGAGSQKGDLVQNTLVEVRQKAASASASSALPRAQNKRARTHARTYTRAHTQQHNTALSPAHTCMPQIPAPRALGCAQLDDLARGMRATARRMQAVKSGTLGATRELHAAAASSAYGGSSGGGGGGGGGAGGPDTRALLRGLAAGVGGGGSGSEAAGGILSPKRLLAAVAAREAAGGGGAGAPAAAPAAATTATSATRAASKRTPKK